MTSQANASGAGKGPFYRGLLRRLAAVEDGAILRFAFFALLIGTLSVLYVDFRELSASAPLDGPPQLAPILPPALEGPDPQYAPEVTTSPQVLDQPLEIALRGGGQLHLTGTIAPGSAEQFAAEIAARGEYVKAVVLDSPGGSVMDALAMGALIRDKGLSTKVEAGALCASSCPLVFAGGIERIASAQAAIGVHQVYAAAIGGAPIDAVRAAGTAMSDAQSVTGQIIAHLTESGVDPALWLHALETPPERLYYLSGEEMTRLKLVTELSEN